MQRVRVLIVDDSGAVREGLRQLLTLEDDIEVVGEAGDGWEAIEQASLCSPDVVLMDVNLPSLSGIDATRRIKRKFPQMSVVFLAAEAIWYDQGLAAGGDAYITKGEPSDRLLAAIRGQLLEEPLPVEERRGPAPSVSVWISRLRHGLPTAPLITAQTLKALISLSGLAAFLRESTGALARLPFLARKRLMGQLWPQLKEALTHGRLAKVAGAVVILGFLLSLYLVADLRAFLKQMTLGGVIAGISLTFGIIFFLYAARYYSVIALILLFSGEGNFNNGNNFRNGAGSGTLNGIRNGLRNGLRNGFKNGLHNGVRRLFSHQGETNGVYNGLNGVMKNGLRNGLRQLFLHNGLKNGFRNGLKNGFRNGLRNGIFNGLYNGNRRLNAHNLPLHLDGHPFVSIHLPLYNEKRVVERLLTACTSLEYDNYEVIVADDSSDETLEYLEEWAKHPRIKVSHRINRKGFKGAALRYAVEVMDPTTEFVMIFDADFLPPPDIIWQCLAYFFGENGSNNNNNLRNNERGRRYVDDRIAVVQGYQWHMLNADENWITKGIRAEYSGSYVIERSSQELLGTMKMISGSVYMIRADVLRKLGWGTSITEDWELTIKLYLDGYKVLYTPFIQAPAECVSTLHRLIRQRMRWAEGHTYNVKKFFPLVMASPNISLREKLEFLYYAPYYLQSAFFIMGTACWFLSEIIMHGKFPYWTSLFGWSLVFTNMGALALMNLSGLFMERGVKHEWGGVLSAMLLGTILVPFQAYAALKGLLAVEEGGWFRTPKSGKITEFFDRLDLGGKLRSLLPRRRRRGHKGRVSKATDVGGFSWLTRRRSRLAHGLISVMLAGTLIVGSMTVRVPMVEAAVGSSTTFYLLNYTTPLTYMMDQTWADYGTTSTSGLTSFYSDVFSDPDYNQVLAGTTYVYLYCTTTVKSSRTIQVTLYAGYPGAETNLGSGTITCPGNTSTPTEYSTSFSTSAYTFASDQRLRLELAPQNSQVSFHWGSASTQSYMVTATIVPERLLGLLFVVPAFPFLARKINLRRRHRARSRC